MVNEESLPTEDVAEGSSSESETQPTDAIEEATELENDEGGPGETDDQEDEVN